MKHASCEVLLVNLGTPESPTPEAVRAFLAEFLADPMVVTWPRLLWLPILHGIVLRKRPARVAELYRSIWLEGGSPLKVGTEALAQALAAELGADFAVRATYRYGQPALAEEVRAAAERAEEVLVLPLFPQRTASSSGSIVQLVDGLGLGERVRCVAIAPNADFYIAALKEALLAAGLSDEDHLIVSLHGIPASVDLREGARYSSDCEFTRLALAEALGRPPESVELCYQSRFGPGQWLQPATARRLEELPAEGKRRLFVIAPGFLTDGLETLEELGIQGREAFLAKGGEQFRLLPALADSPPLVSGLAQLLRGQSHIFPAR